MSAYTVYFSLVEHDYSVGILNGIDALSNNYFGCFGGVFSEIFTDYGVGLRIHGGC